MDIQGSFLDYKKLGASVELIGKTRENGNEYYKV